MAEAVGLTASIATLINVATNIVQYVNTLQKFSVDSTEFAQEASLILSLMLRLQLKIQGPEALDDTRPGSKSTRMILATLVPQIRKELLLLSDILHPGTVSKTQAVKRHLVWPIKVTSVREALSRLERLKSLVGLALDDNLSDLVGEIRKDTELLRSLPKDMGNLSSKLDKHSQDLKETDSRIRDEIDHVGVRLTSLHDQGERAARKQRQGRIVDFIAPFDFSTRYSTLVSQTLRGTGEWFLKSPQFEKWSGSDGGIFWCSGMPGAGKSILAANAVSHLQLKEASNETVAVLFVFCDYQQNRDQNSINLLSSLWRQLMQLRLLELQECSELEIKYQGPQRHIRPTSDEILNMIQQEFHRYRKVFVVVDAIDELKPNHCSEFSEALCSLQRVNCTTRSDKFGSACARMNHIKIDLVHASSHMNLMITSRLTSHQTYHFGRVSHLEIKAGASDLRKYIIDQTRGAHLRRIWKHTNKDPSLLEEIVTVITHKAEGMFLLARFHIESLLDKHTIKAVRSTLKELPEGRNAISKAYDEALDRILEQNLDDRTLALRVLSWLLSSYQPIRLFDIQYALTVEEDEDLDEDDLLPAALIVSVCAGLVVYEVKTGILRFVHYTAQEYLESIRSTRFPDADFDIAMTSLHYLSKGTYAMNPRKDKIDHFDSLVKQTPFYAYASTYWGDHARRFQDAENASLATRIPGNYQPPKGQQILELMDDFLDLEAQGSCAVRALLSAAMKESGGALGYALRQHPSSLQKINVCAYFGLHKGIEHYLERDEAALNNSIDDFFGHTLHWAVLGGHTHTLQMLLQRPECRRFINMMQFCKTADDLIPFKARSDLSPLHLAAYIERPAMAQILLDNGADPALQNKGRYTPIHVAAHSGSMKSLETILGTESGKRALLLKDKLQRNALCEAAIHGSTKALEILAHATESLMPDGTLQDTMGDYTGRNPLHYAAERGYPDSVRVLLASGLGKQFALGQDDTGFTPLHQAIFWGYEECVREFLRWDHVDLLFSDPHNVAYNLKLAAYHGHARVLRLIFDTVPMSSDMIKNLHGSDTKLGVKYRTGSTVWHSAAQGGNVEAMDECVKKLASDIEVDVKDSPGTTAFIYAAQRGHIDVISYLTKLQADIDGKTNRGDAALHLATTNNLDTVICWLLSAGANVNVLDAEGNTPLALAAKKHWTSAAMLLIKAGADVLSVSATSSEGTWLRAQPWASDVSLVPPTPWLPDDGTAQLKAAFFVKMAFKKRLNPELIGYIFDLAGCWITTRLQVHRRVSTTERTGHICYITTPPISGYPLWPVRSLSFTATGYEEIIQNCLWPANNDRAYTWWDAGSIIPTPDGLKEPVGPIKQNVSGPILFRNTHKGPLVPETKSCVWPRHGHRLEWGALTVMVTDDPLEPVPFFWAEESTELACVQWIRGLREGQRVVFKPIACFGDKLHHVLSAEATICVSYLKR
ncbi:hypothetical protein OPT61_g6554 [Boeremia exigua]|uniref:Uncharacterized protein n=1 Tax=Boeremia exigua TaxID=749465 RepID=A0ACC2I5U3_9PLEO|nr:hypothetical protein OPT61_g6554 [Boeremia exigua]